MKAIKYLFVTGLLLIILVPLVFFNYEKDVVSVIDNKYLTEITEEITSKSFTKNLDDYISERIGFRNQMIKYFEKIDSKLFNSVSGKFVGKNNEYLNDFTAIQAYDSYIEKFVESVKKVYDYCRERDIPFYLMFNPDKVGVYTEYIPDGFTYNTSCAEKVIDEFEKYGINVVDNLKYFREIKDDVKVYNSRNDIVHWSELGAFYGINNLLKSIGEEFESVEVNNINDYQVYEEFVEYDNEGKKIDELCQFIMWEDELDDLTWESIYDLNQVRPFVNFNHFVNKKEGSENLPKVLSFQSSFMYTNDVQKYLANQVKELVTIHNYQNVYNIDQYFNMFQPDMVVFEFAQFTMKEYYFSEERMDNIDFNPGLNTLLYNQKDIDDFLYVETRDYGAGSKVTTTGDPGVEYDYAYLICDGKTYDIKLKDGYNCVITKGDLIPVGAEVEVIFVDMNNKVKYHFDAYVY